MLSSHPTQFYQRHIRFANPVSKKDWSNSPYAKVYLRCIWYNSKEVSPKISNICEIYLVFNFIFEFLLSLITNQRIVNQTNNHSKTAPIWIVRHETFVMAAHSGGANELTSAIGCKIGQLIHKWFKLLFKKVLLIHGQYEYVNTIIFWWNFRCCCWWSRSCNVDILTQLIIQSNSFLKNKIRLIIPHLDKL